MATQQVVFSPHPFPASALGSATTCSPNGTNVVNAALSSSNIQPSTIPANTTVSQTLNYPLTLPTMNGIGVGIALPPGGPVEDASDLNLQGQSLDLMIINASDYQIWVTFGDLGNTAAQPPGEAVPIGPTAPVGPGVAGCLVVPPQTNVLLTTNSAIAAVTGHNPQVVTGAVALAAQGANFASIYSTGGSGTVTFMRGFANIQYLF